jgi:hypothetical protein
MSDKEVLLNEVRYAERLCERTARLYRNLQAFGTFATVIGGSAAMTVLATAIPKEISLFGSAVFVLFGAAMLAVGPANKAATNEADRKRYARLKADAVAMDADALRLALAKAREGDVQEVESLRAIAYNDMVCEVGQPQEVIPITAWQKALAVLA